MTGRNLSPLQGLQYLRVFLILGQDDVAGVAVVGDRLTFPVQMFAIVAPEASSTGPIYPALTLR